MHLARRAALSLLVLSAFCGSALGADKPPEKPKRLMALDFPAVPELTPSTMTALNETLGARLRELGLTVLSPADIEATLGVDRQRQLLGCGASSCLAELGAALGVDYIVRGSVSVLDQDTLLTLALIDTKGSELNHARVHVSSRSSSQLVKALEQLVPQLVAPLHPGANASFAASTPGTHTPPAGGLQPSATATQPAPGGSNAQRTTGLTLMIAGGVATLVGIVAGGYGLAQRSSWQSQIDSDLAHGDATGAADLQRQGRSTATFAWIAGGTGVAALCGGAYLLYTSGAPAPAPSAEAAR
ncbi:MAG: hypothetical protein JST54_15050 [Deltaproteobacteria bacterium]|nr:hypothetical protein [Deltaproteobacteria bacterium]